MMWPLSTLRPLWRIMVTAYCLLLVFSSAVGQTTPQAYKDEFVKKAFTKCHDKYYLLLTDTGKPFCGGVVPWAPLKCLSLTEYEGAQFSYEDMRPTPADANQGYITMNFSTLRVRHIVDGVWAPWGLPEKPKRTDPKQLAKNGFLRIEFIKQEKNYWSAEIGPAVASPILSRSIGWLEDQVSCDEIDNAPGPLPNPPHARSGLAVTTRLISDPNPKSPGSCALPEGTTVLIVGDAPEYDRAKVSVWNRKPSSVSCSKALIVKEEDIRLLGRRGATEQSSPVSNVFSGKTAGDSSSIAKFKAIETTAGPKGLQLRLLPKPEYGIAFTVPANATVIVDAKNADGWLHVQAKQASEHWTPTPPFYGWAPPGSLPGVP